MAMAKVVPIIKVCMVKYVVMSCEKVFNVILCLRNADFEINLDGYLFEGKDWNFLKYHMPFRLSGLVEATPITVKEGNFFKSRPEHESKNKTNALKYLLK